MSILAMLHTVRLRRSTHLSACARVLALLALPACSSVPATAPAQRQVAAAAPVTDPALAAGFTNLSRDGEVYFAGWPSEAGLRALAARGVHTVISLKTVDEIRAAKGYDAQAVAGSLGITLVVIPVRAGNFSAADVAAFAAAFDASRGPVLVHCGSSNTAGGMWAAYLALHRGLGAADAIDRGRAAGLRDGAMMDATQAVIGGVKAP